MFNEMICSRCKDIVSITSTSVELPFVCEECIEAENPEVEGLVPTPEPPPLSEILETEKGYGSWTAADGSQQIQFTTPLPSDESTATVENTTLLIADLEQQIADSKEALDKSTELIGDLTQQLSGTKEKLTQYDEAGFEVTQSLIAMTKRRNDWRELACQQATKLEQLISRLARLSSHNQQLIANNRELVDRKRHFWKKAFFYETRGFWARVFNAQYQS